MNLLLSRLDEQQRCWSVAVESNSIGPGGDRLLSQVTGLDKKTSNGCHLRLWNEPLQEHLSDRYGLTVVVSHYPTGCSKWNPIEHRLFSSMSLNWAGCPGREF
jgi:hypothetical protein